MFSRNSRESVLWKEGKEGGSKRHLLSWKPRVEFGKHIVPAHVWIYDKDSGGELPALEENVKGTGPECSSETKGNLWVRRGEAHPLFFATTLLWRLLCGAGVLLLESLFGALVMALVVASFCLRLGSKCCLAPS